MAVRRFKITSYREAWLSYRKSQEYLNTDIALKARGMPQRFRNNIQQSAFAAGWRASGVEIKFIN